ncbi:tetratricopeptide repeat protein [Rivibacter subsaxonicus]|uniref:Tetratricopeptide repeat protein n=2 Tax=Rivibacter subsaxonicus TaxID=457575 RepID=A0A4Q7VNB5_9BURK|nr:tetratricopeptide repeat protein [Rivibacter subsaxonicus]
MLGLGRSVISSIIGAGFVTPVRGARNEYRFSFQDVVLLRTAHDLRTARIPRRRVLRALQILKDKLPVELPLSGLRITAIGNDVVVREGTTHREVETGQLLFDFGVSSSAGTVTFLQPTAASAEAIKVEESDWFARGEQLETSGDFSGAEQAYRQALADNSNHGDAYLNLGAILCEDGRCDEAVALYDQAIRHCPDNALLHFNRAIALEDQHREREALTSYERTLELAPDLADAHYNAARLHEMLGQVQGALRHFSAYRRLQP